MVFKELGTFFAGISILVSPAHAGDIVRKYFDKDWGREEYRDGTKKTYHHSLMSELVTVFRPAPEGKKSTMLIMETGDGPPIDFCGKYEVERVEYMGPRQLPCFGGKAVYEHSKRSENWKTVQRKHDEEFRRVKKLFIK